MWFGTYLCEQDVIAKEMMLDAVGGYYSTRPKIGRLALESKMLTVKDVKEILGQQAEFEAPFGKIARQLGMLTEAQVEILIGRQFSKCSLWKYMINENILAQEQFDHWMARYRAESYHAHT